MAFLCGIGWAGIAGTLTGFEWSWRWMDGWEWVRGVRGEGREGGRGGGKGGLEMMDLV